MDSSHISSTILREYKTMKVTEITVRNADNGFILEWYEEESRITIHNTMNEVLSAISALLWKE